MHRNSVWIGLILLVIGLSSLGGAVWFGSQISSFASEAARTTGTVIAFRPCGKGTKSPVVKFTPTGSAPITFHSSSCSNPPAFYVGEEVKVLYRPDAPDQTPRIQTFFQLWSSILWLVALGVIFTGLGIYSGWEWGKERRLRSWLSRHGVRVKAKVTGIDLAQTQQERGLPLYCISCEWFNPELQLMQFFFSDAIRGDPSDQVGPEIDVLVDPEDDERYLVDLSFLKPSS